ncbi:MAG: ribbon-helix-helix protein, CopG family [Dehalococcoidia bacterium]
MRTTVEIDDESLKELRKLAAERGEKGFSGLVNRAIVEFLASEHEAEERARRERRAATILNLAGSVSEESAQAMQQSVRESRTNWRRG